MAFGHSNEGKKLGTISPSSVGGGRDYVKWLEDEPKRRMAAIKTSAEITTPQEESPLTKKIQTKLWG